jgi:hypothetical protein
MRIIKTSGLTMKIIKTEDLSNNQTIYEGLAKMMIPSFCELIQKNDCFRNFENITITVNLNTPVTLHLQQTSICGYFDKL